MTDYLTRVAAIAAREQAKSATQRDENRARYPEASAFISSLREAGMLHAVTVDGQRYGKAPLPDRRTGPVPSRPPGVSLAGLREICDNIMDTAHRKRYGPR